MVMEEWPRLDKLRYNMTGGHVEVYRRDDRLVFGVCMSLYAATSPGPGFIELMRFDFPVGKPHRHWAVKDQDRLYYPRNWPQDVLFDLACQEMRDHAKTVAKLAEVPVISPRVLNPAAVWARKALKEVQVKHNEARVLRDAQRPEELEVANGPVRPVAGVARRSFRRNHHSV